MKKIICLLYAILMLSGIRAPNNGTVRGIVRDESSGEILPFATIYIKETGGGTTGDLDGNYMLSLPEGTYTLIFSLLSYQSDTLKAVQVKSTAIQLIDVQLKETTQNLEEVVVVAKQSRSNMAVISKIKKNASGMIDGISAESFTIYGDGDAGAAVKRITGVSVEGGKNVFIRGLGDRYTRTLLNNMDIPALDPDKNSVQMDMFPAALIDNIIVHKTFSPDLPGDFTGGMVDIVTKDFPDQKSANAALSISYSPLMHLHGNAIGYKGGNYDFLGFDDGTRKSPFSHSIIPPNPAANKPLLTALTSGFSPNMSVHNKTLTPDFNASFSVGNQMNRERATWGYVFAINYGKENKFYETAEFNEYTKNRNDLTSTELTINRSSAGAMAEENVLWSALLGTSLKYKAHKYSFNVLHFQNGIAKSADLLVKEFEDNPATILRQNLEYSQRAISSFNVLGKHSLNETLTADWKVSYIRSGIAEPDLRSTPFEITNEGNYIIDRSIGAVPTRSFRYLDENNVSAKIDVEKRFKWRNGEMTKLKGGLFNIFKMRNFSIVNYVFPVQNAASFNFSGNPDELFAPENIWTVNSGKGVYAEGQQEPANRYEAAQNIGGAYMMNELPLHRLFKITYGVRAEKTDIVFSGQNNLGTIIKKDENILNTLDVLPSVNILSNIKENWNIRFAYSRTVARPTFKEKSLVQVQDFISGRTFLGNIDLKRSLIHNLDLRSEYFFKGADFVSLSGFYKSIQDPIEIVAYNENSPDNIQAKNVDAARILGAEFEINRSFALNTSADKKITTAFNITLVDAQTTMSEAEFLSRQSKARPGEVIKKERAMLGQSPYIINASVGFVDMKNVWEFNVNYNVQGDRLVIAGIGIIPDVYEKSFDLVNIKVVKKIGSQRRTKISFTASNILNSERVMVYHSYQAQEQIYSKFRIGSAFALGLNYQFY
ncbi:MAG: TonB-dependent receptor [Sphingobacteriales bacterium]|nr:TonB-dependent receptor [Sphingobacteriales bacterium]